MIDFMSQSPLKILEKSSRKTLGPGNLGALIARAGVGKTAFLIHIAFDKIFRDRQMLHVSLGDAPEKVTHYYEVIYSDVVRALNMKEESDVRSLIERNRMILSYLNRSFELSRLRDNMRNLAENLNFRPETVIVDGVDFGEAERDLFEGFKEVAGEFEAETWFSALSHRHIREENERGIPYPCDRFDDLFSMIIQLNYEASGAVLRLLKDHDHPSIKTASARLDPNTFLLMESL